MVRVCSATVLPLELKLPLAPQHMKNPPILVSLAQVLCATHQNGISEA